MKFGLKRWIMFGLVCSNIQITVYYIHMLLENSELRFVKILWEILILQINAYCTIYLLLFDFCNGGILIDYVEKSKI